MFFGSPSISISLKDLSLCMKLLKSTKIYEGDFMNKVLALSLLSGITILCTYPIVSFTNSRFEYRSYVSITFILLYIFKKEKWF